MRALTQAVLATWLAATGLTVVAALVGCGSPGAHTAPVSVVEKVARDCASLPLIISECRERRAQECPDLKAGECNEADPCPQCPVVDECRAQLAEACK